MASRERYGAWGEPSMTPLQRYIQNAVDPQNYEPNLALNLEVADLVNSKKGNAPREAAVAIVGYINHRNPNVSLLALALLDICVKNCGYPFHLQISTKEFLNELVRRFPERPPLRATRVQMRILESIEEWRQTICQTSRYKEDLGFIRDMHRLLLYKGYVFPEVRREDAAVLNPSDNLKSAEEMEEEEKAAQSAKLQELIRRGGPEDLQEANRLMKVMAGYDTRNKTDYRAKAAEEVSKVQEKARLLEEMLEKHKSGEVIAEGDVFEELANALQSAHPKIQRMCEEESDDSEAVAKLLEINDSIHRTVERYKLMKKGDYSAAQQIPKGTLGTSTGVGKNANNELSLIDFGGDEPSSNGGADPVASSSSNPLEDDLLGLSFQDGGNSYGQAGGISLGFGENTNMPGQPLLSSTMQSNTAKVPTPIASPPPPHSVQPNYNAFADLSSLVSPPSQSTTPIPTSIQNLPHQQPVQPPAQQADPFAALMSTSRTASPFSQQQRASPAPSAGLPSSLLGLASSSSSPGPQFPTGNGNQAPTAAEDDEWDFASSLPPSSAPSLPSTNRVALIDSGLKVEFAVQRRQATTPPSIAIVALFSNNTAQQLSEIELLVAVERAFKLQLKPQSGVELAPNVANGIRQDMLLTGVEPGKGNSIKIRFRIKYRVGGANGELKQEQGSVPPLGIM